MFKTNSRRDLKQNWFKKIKYAVNIKIVENLDILKIKDKRDDIL